jgi:hypothetical protein
MNCLYERKEKFVICGDIYADYLSEIYHKQCQHSLLTCCNLISIFNFPTRIKNYSSNANDNMFIDSSKKVHISLERVLKGY